MFQFLGAAAGSGNGASMIIIMVVMLVAFYFFLIRPENKKKKEAEAMRKAVKVGDNITTIGGIIGDVCHIKDDIVVLEVGADRVRIEFHTWAISSNNTAQKDAAKAREAAKAKKDAEKKK